MKIRMGEGIVRRTARCSVWLVLAIIHDGMTCASRSWRRWGTLGVLAMCFISPAAAGQDLQQQAKPPAHKTLTQELQQQSKPPPHIVPNVVAGPPAKTMPYLIGKTSAQALNILKDEDLPRPSFGNGPSDRPRGEVYAQYPAPGARLAAGQQISLSVSSSIAPGQDLQQQAEPPTRIASNVVPIDVATKMPNLIGRTYAQAVNILTAMRLPKPSTSSGPSRWPKGQIYGQSPAPNANMQGVMAVTLQVSDGPYPPPQTMPGLIGMPYKNAFGILEQLQLPHPNLQYVPSNQPEGVIIGQSPSRGAKMQGIAVVSLQVSSGADISVPDVVGSSESDATASITQGQLHAVPQGDESSRRSQGQVTRTEPVSGTLVHAGATVMYWLASGNNVVPDLLRRKVDDAQVILKRAGFRPGGVSYKTTPGPAGLVVDQDPKPRSIASMNSPVAITVGTTLPALPPMPHVEGMTPDQAASTLNKTGFATVTVVHKFHLSMPNRVFHQDPQPSAAIDPNTKVSLEVPSSTGLAVFAAGLFAGVGGIGAGLLRAYQRYLIKITKPLLHIKPSLEPRSETRITHDLPPQMDEPAVSLRPRLELEEGDVIFDGPVSIERQEISHD